MPELAIREQISQLAPKATPVRYQYAIDENHIMVLQTKRFKPRRVRCVIFQPYHGTTTRVVSCMYTRRAFTTHRNTNTSDMHNIFPASTSKAKTIPDAAKSEKAHDDEFENLNTMSVVQWIPDADLPEKANQHPSKWDTDAREIAKDE